MSILAECPFCHKKQSNKNKKCSCGGNLDKAKKSKKVNYWINYRVNGVQKREKVGKSLGDAQVADGKRKAQAYENPAILEIITSSKLTFHELSNWYLTLNSVKSLRSYDRVKGCLKNFNKRFGNTPLSKIKLENLINYQLKRTKEGLSPATIDMEIKYAQTVVTKAIDNEKIDARLLTTFRKVKRLLKKGSNARKRILSFDEYIRLIEVSPTHLQSVLTISFNTGMRPDEIRKLKWENVDKDLGFIRLPPTNTKEKKEKSIPINKTVKNLLKSLIRHIDHDYVITYKGSPIRQKDGFKRSFKTACLNADIPHGNKTKDGLTMRDIRRTVKTNMLRAGVQKAYRDLILGHSLQGMDAYYISPDDETLKQAMNKYSTWIETELLKVEMNQKIKSA